MQDNISLGNKIFEVLTFDGDIIDVQKKKKAVMYIFADKVNEEIFFSFYKSPALSYLMSQYIVAALYKCITKFTKYI